MNTLSFVDSATLTIDLNPVFAFMILINSKRSTNEWDL